MVAATVCVPGRSPFSQLILHETDESNIVRMKQKTFSFNGQTKEDELIRDRPLYLFRCER